MKQELDFAAMSDREHSIRAGNRAIQAISMVGTLQSDLRRAQDRITDLEDQMRDYADLIAEMLTMMELSRD